MFPDSRAILFVFSPVLAVFFIVCDYFVHVWEPTSTTDKVGRGLLLEVISSFLVLCVVGFVASVVGQDPMRPVILRVGGKAGLAELLLILGFVSVFALLRVHVLRAKSSDKPSKAAYANAVV
jgi:hypothetical protein